MAPISMSIYSPGTDFMHTINSILYLRQCTLQSLIIRNFVSFHIYFEDIHFPEYVRMRLMYKRTFIIIVFSFFSFNFVYFKYVYRY